MRLKPFALGGDVFIVPRRERLPHIGVPLVLLVYQVVSRSYMVVAIGFETSDRVVFFKLEIVDQTLKQFALVRHLLETRVEALLFGLLKSLFLCASHVRMTTNLANTNSRLWVRIEDLCYEIFALGRQELWHLVVCGHDLFVQVRCLWVLEWQVAGDHGVKDDSARPNIRLKTMIALACNHLRCGIAWRATGRL